jgi:hypothetical protein
MLIFTPAALLGVYGIVRGAINGKMTSENLPGILFAFIWTGGMSFFAGFLIWKVFFRPDSYSRIDQQGITVDRRSWPWSDVDCVFAQRAGTWPWPSVDLCFHLKRWRGLSNPVHSHPHLKPDEAKAILDRLADYLAEHHPEVGVG